MASNSIDTFKDVELDSLMSLLGDDEMLPLPCEDSGCGLSMNDSGTTLDSLDDVMEFHDCFDSLPDDFDAIPQFNMVDDAGIIPIEPTNVPSTSSIEPSTSSIVPTNVPSSSSNVPTNVPSTNIDTGLMSALLLNALLSNSVNVDQLLVHANTEGIIPKEPQTDLCNLQRCVQHDHTYASGSGTSLITTGGSSIGKTSSDTAGGKSDSDIEEGSSSDTGYDDTMSTSPGSSSVDQPSPSHPSPFLSFMELPSDPVKLIDERIKFFMSRQQEVKLTKEEKETLKAEGLPIPTTLPLTRTEERALKSVRRKLRNKVAAQESRKKKKEYIDQLENRVKLCTDENSKLKKKVDTLETENKTLLQQLAQLQALVTRANSVLGRPFHLGTGLMVIVLCFGILFGNLLPYKVSITATDYTTVSAVRSRALLSMPEESRDGFMSYFGSLLLGHSHMTTPIEATSVDEERHVHWMVDIVNLTSSHSPVIVAKA